MTVSPLPRAGGVVFDSRGAMRALRVTAHPQQGLVSLSMWRGDECVATHQLPASDVPQLIKLLADALAATSATTTGATAC